MPASASAAAAAPASGTRCTANGLSAAAHSASGPTASSGWNCADEPTTITTASTPGDVINPARTSRTVAALVPARVRSSSRPEFAAMPCRLSRRRTFAGTTTSIPSWPRQSTTMAPPPPVVVITATRRPRARRRAANSGTASIRDSNMCTRAIP